jgi:hypothetical protein
MGLLEASEDERVDDASYRAARSSEAIGEGLPGGEVLWQNRD